MDHTLTQADLEYWLQFEDSNRMGRREPRPQLPSAAERGRSQSPPENSGGASAVAFATGGLPFVAKFAS
ncbi:hypothetical protein T439DRAFT_357416 [Meredithblackwellia eburnea MCA 4105]